MNKRLALLLDQPDNRYQQILAQEAARSATEHGLELAEPQYARGSTVAQMDSLLQCTRDEKHADGVLLMPAGSGSQLPASKRALSAGVSLVHLNRIPPYLAELRAAYPDVPVAGVTPDQAEIGRIQAAQAARLLPHGGFVLLITGTPGHPSACARREGFLTSIAAGFVVHELDGLWTEESSFAALSSWFRLGADRERDVSLVVCQNDPMGVGARRALVQEAARSGNAAVARIPVVGCDGVPSEGQALVLRNELQATVVMPPTTPRAVEMLVAFWTRGVRGEVDLLRPASFPTTEHIKPA